MEMVQALRMYRKMFRFPHLLGEMRKIFLRSLRKQGITDPDRLHAEAVAVLTEEGLEADEDRIREYMEVLTDLYFVRHFTDTEIEDHINFARKQDRFRHLSALVNTEQASTLSILKALKEFCDIPQGEMILSENESMAVRVALIKQFISTQLPFIGVSKHFLTIRDISEVLERSYWNREYTGKIGGKAAGMFLAHKVLLPRFAYKDPELERYVTIPDSYYFNSGIFSEFVEYNNLYECHSIKYEPVDTIEDKYESIVERFQQASYPPDTLKQFSRFLAQVGEQPLILRSSTLLEDSIGHTFSGKYDSVFVANQGDPETRLQQFIAGLNRVFVSTFGPAPIMYRRKHGLIDFDERMSVLVQKVVGRRFNGYVFPMAAGVAFSMNPYHWTSRIRKEEGCARLVFGLGTRAVERIAGDYPRMVSLDKPLLRPEVTADQICRYSQKMVDVLNLGACRVEPIPFLPLLSSLNYQDIYYLVSINEEMHLSPPLFRGQPFDLHKSCITLENFLLKTPFVALMRNILRRLEEAYSRPVEIEFAWDDDKLYLLQCRSLPVKHDSGVLNIPPNIPESRILFTNHRGVTNGAVYNIEYIVYVDPESYDRLNTPQEKLKVARAVERINRGLAADRYALLGPGRWGSNDLNLGVKVAYQGINNTLLLGEIVFGEENSAPEATYGTHFFNDLVESEIIPLAIYPDTAECTFRKEFLLNAPNRLRDFAPDFMDLDPVIRVIHVPASTNGLFLQVIQDGRNQRGMGYFDAADGSEGN